jgi:hypothetical protein
VKVLGGGIKHHYYRYGLSDGSQDLEAASAASALRKKLLALEPISTLEASTEYLNKGDHACVASVLLYLSCRCLQSIPRSRSLWVQVAEVRLAPVAREQAEVAREQEALEAAPPSTRNDTS